jgi:hypothetical protein
MRNVVLKSVCVSILIAVLFQVSNTLLFSEALTYDPPVDSEWLHSLPAEQRSAWYEEHVHERKGFDLLSWQFKSYLAFSQYMKSLLVDFLPVFASSLVTGLWLSKSKRSNKALNADAPKDGAPVS